MEIDLALEVYIDSDDEDVVSLDIRRNSVSYCSYASSSVAEKRSTYVAIDKNLPPRHINVMNFAPPYVAAETIHRATCSIEEKLLFSQRYKEFRKQNVVYDRRVYDILQSSVQIYDTRVMVVGCGDGKGIVSVLREGPRSVVFLDNDQKKLNSLSARLALVPGIENIHIEYLCCDALAVNPDDYDFDVIIMIKCVGQIIKGRRPQERLMKLMAILEDVLVPGGTLLTDYHCYGSGSFRRISEMGLPDYDIASVFGIYGDDIDVHLSSHYGHLVMVFDVDPIGDLPGMETGAQVWRLKLFRKDNIPHQSDFPYHISPIVSRVQPIVGIVDEPQLVVRDLIRPSMKGVKRVCDYRDLEVLVPHDFTCKFDGVGGILLINDITATFISPLRTYTVGLIQRIDQIMRCNAESVRLADNSLITVIVGILDINGIAYNPNDIHSLIGLSSAESVLGHAGIIVQGNYYSTVISGRNTQARTFDNKLVKIPIDGFNVPLDRYGTFIKPRSMVSFDVRASEAAAVLEALKSCVDFLPENMVVKHSFSAEDKDVVFEYVISMDKGWFFPRRKRLDKQFSNTMGRNIVDLLCFVMSYALDTGDSLSSLYQRFLSYSTL